jgi:exopolyphosphatase/guanosine-5'-triphosphate,3'-diphosphate pyrophosphatase
LQQVQGGPEDRLKLIERVLRKAAATVEPEGQRIYLVGGSWRVIARLDMERRGYPLTVLHEYRMQPKSVLETIDWIGRNDLAALRGRTGTSAERMDLVPLACEVLGAMVRLFKPKEIDVSSYGIREGLLYEQMPQRLRERDPLIEAARMAEATQARIPGFGKKLFAFLSPLFKDVPPDRLRLIKAACLLHDTTWRAHPDYRAEVCFDNATRANLGALTHSERVFLGLALLHRYKNARGSSFDALAGLIPAEDLTAAEVLGKAMRFGAMLSVNAPEKMGTLKLHPRRKEIELILPRPSADLFGEVVSARFNSLARAMGCTTRITLR